MTAPPLELAPTTPRLALPQAITVLIAVMFLVDTLPMAFSGVALTMRALTAAFPGPNISWIITTLLLVGGSTQPLAGKLADKFGAKQVLLTMAAAYLAGSIVCALAPNLAILLLGRGLQACIWALPAVAYAMFRLTFPPRLVPIAVGMLATGLGIGIIFCPLLFGWMLQHYSFRSVFWFSAAYTVVVSLPIALLVPNTAPSQRGRAVGATGMLLFTALAGAILLGVSRGGAWGWFSAPTLGCLAAAIVAALLFARSQHHSADPFLDFKFIRSQGVRSSLLIAFLLSIPLGGYTYIIPQMLLNTGSTGGYAFALTALAVGLYTLPQAIASTIAAPTGGYLSMRISPRSVVLASAILLTLSCLAFALDTHATLLHVMVIGAIEGIAFGFFYSSIGNLMIEAIPASVTGTGTGVMSCFESIGNAAAIAIVSNLLLSHSVAPSGHAHPALLPAGFRSGFFFMAAASAIAIVSAFVMRHGRRPATGGLAHQALDPSDKLSL